MRLAWCSLACLLLVPLCCLGDVQHISIVLRPRHYVHPRNRTDFVCGLQSELDAGRLLAELSSPYILQLLDNTEDPDARYRTTIQDIAFLTPTGAIHMMPSPCNASCHALFALVLVPPTGTCYTGLFSDAEVLGKDHTILYIGASLPDDVLAKYGNQADMLAGLYGGEMPRLCVIQSPMEVSVAQSRVASLAALFNFAFEGANRRLANQDLCCTTVSETEQSLAFSGIFDYNPASVVFEEENNTVLEETGRCEMNISRSTTGKVGVAFVETTLDTATRSDLVPYNGPVAFSSRASSASFIVQIKVDDVQEDDETFSFNLKKVSKRSKRSTAKTTAQMTISDEKTTDGQPRALPLERACLWGTALQVTGSFLDGTALTQYSEYIANMWTKKTSKFQIPKGVTFETKCTDYATNKDDLFRKIFKKKKQFKEYQAYTEFLQKGTLLKTKSPLFVEYENMFQEEKTEFENQFFPCMLQDILVNRPEQLGGRWNPREEPDLFRLTSVARLKKNFGIEIKDDNWSKFVKKNYETKNFLSFAMKEEEKTYITDTTYFGTRDIGLEILVSDRKKKKLVSSAVSIKEFNSHEEGEREAIFPVGTRFFIVSYQDTGETRAAYDLTVEEQLAWKPRHVFRLRERTEKTP